MGHSHHTTMMSSKSLILTLAVVVGLAAARPEVKDLIKELNELEHDIALVAKDSNLHHLEEPSGTCQLTWETGKRASGKCYPKGSRVTTMRNFQCGDWSGDCGERETCCYKDEVMARTQTGRQPRGRKYDSLKDAQENINRWDPRNGYKVRRSDEIDREIKRRKAARATRKDNEFIHI